MNNQADRTKRWRERQRAEGKTSITVLLSEEARTILKEEKEKSGESYAAIIEKAVISLKGSEKRLLIRKHSFKREEIPDKLSPVDHQTSPIPVTSDDNKHQSQILIDDLANYRSLKDLERDREGKDKTSLSDTNFNDGLIVRLLRSSANPFGRKKKWFR